MRLRWRFVCLWIGLWSAAPAHGAGQLRSTEWKYDGDEFVEIANVGDVQLELAGWSFSQHTEQRGNESLTPLGILGVRASALLSGRSAAEFRAAWDLATNMAILGNDSQNLGRAGEINLYDPTTALVDRLTHDVAAGQGPGTPVPDELADFSPQQLDSRLPEPSVSFALVLALAALGLYRRSA